VKKKAAGPKAVKPGRGEGGVRVAHAEFSAGAARRDQVPTARHFDEAPEIAFAGRSNVGKSSLLNMLLSRKGLARTSNTPGCTRQINFFDVRLAQSESGGISGPNAATAPGELEGRSASATGEVAKASRIVFVDLPGYGYAKVSKSEATAWKELLEGYLHERPTLRAVVILVDVRRGLEQEELDLIEFLEQRPATRIIVVATKLDKLPRAAQKPALARLAKGREGERPVARSVVATSAETGEGREALWSRILGACLVD
jgi:GTP-binding protein